MPFKGWIEVAWRDVEQDEVVKLKDGFLWKVRAPWNGQQVLLAKEVQTVPQVWGPTAPVPLTDGDKTVQVLRSLAPAGTPSVHDSAPKFGPPTVVGDFEVRSAMTPVPDDPWAKPLPTTDGVPNFKDTLPVVDAPTAEEQLHGQAADDEGRAVGLLVAGGLEPRFVAVEDGGEILVPKMLDDLALRSHLFLMHGRHYTEQDVERDQLVADHAALHEQPASHRHVNREEPA